MPFGAARSHSAAKAFITPAEVAELRELYAELPEVSTAAAEALGVGGLTGLALTRFRELDARVAAIARRIKAILG